MNKRSVFLLFIGCALICLLMVGYIVYTIINPQKSNEVEVGELTYNNEVSLSEDGIYEEYNSIDPNEYTLYMDFSFPKGMFPYELIVSMRQEIGDYLNNSGYTGTHSLPVIKDSLAMNDDLSSFYIALGENEYLKYTYSKKDNKSTIETSNSYEKGKIEQLTLKENKYPDKHLNYSVVTLNKSSLDAKQWLAIENNIFEYLDHNYYDTDNVTVIDHTYIDNEDSISFDCEVNGYPKIVLHLQTNKKNNQLNIWNMQIVEK